MKPLVLPRYFFLRLLMPIIIAVVSTFNLPPCWPSDDNLSLKDSFSSHMIDHPNEGCPANSHCSKQTGIERKKWINFLNHLQGSFASKTKKIEEYRSRHGIPISIWPAPQALADQHLIYWNSPCEHHKVKVYIGEVTGKNISELDPQKFILEEAYLLQDNKEIKKFLLPRMARPYLIKDNSLLIMREEEGHYFVMQITDQGQLRIVNNLPSKNMPEEVNCPQVLQLHAKKEEEHQVIYRDYYCQDIWNYNKNKRDTMLFKWSCQ